MNRFHRQSLLLGLLCTAVVPCAYAQEEVVGKDDEKRVQYQLVLPDEKTPESVKPEEHNPFESESEAQNRLAPGDTEENRVRDKLLKLEVVGVKRMADGRMSVLLGDLILETGREVPAVLPEQLVELKVKNITPLYVELAWQEKRATGLPPKLMIIPINISPKVRYKMLGQTEEQGKAGNGPNATMNFPVREVAAQPDNSPPMSNGGESAPPRAEFVLDETLPASPKALAQTPALGAPAAIKEGDTQSQKKASALPSSPAVESMVRMLFGAPATVPK